MTNKNGLTEEEKEVCVNYSINTGSLSAATNSTCCYVTGILLSEAIFKVNFFRFLLLQYITVVILTVEDLDSQIGFVKKVSKNVCFEQMLGFEFKDDYVFQHRIIKFAIIDKN